ncbi:DUF6371 domain-containing protein [Rufibacter hautae]|uniref:DEAD/DEAH box helicase n=1 Tax=Rufibacter hautae TaxID=2595005 RepID=A0A5B6TEF7_9BACT|nr:DUF6371 domain-containing protein [Rufibacter hautae]KAA3437675.1 DEAD/DEAH box helicase [Rufibacter hautae]
MTFRNDARAMGMALHGTRPTTPDVIDQTGSRPRLISGNGPQLPRADELLADSETLQVLRGYFPNYRRLGKVFETDNSRRVNIYLHKGLFLVKDFTGKEFGDDATRNVLQVLQFYHRCDFKEALVLLSDKLGYSSSGHRAPLRKPMPRPAVPKEPVNEPEQVYVDHRQWDNVSQRLHSTFHGYARSLGVTDEHLKRWHVGTSTRVGTVYTVFGHQNWDGSYFNQKHFIFSIGGNKVTKPFYLKNPAGKRYGQCLYGIHLLREGVPVVLVESEKTAVLGSFFYPQFDFVSTGGAASLSKEKARALQVKSGYVLIDADQAGRSLGTCRMLEKHGLDFIPVDLSPDREDGYDLADALRDGLRPDITDWRFQLRKGHGGPDYKLFVNRFLGEQAAPLVDYIQHHGKVLLKARTGTGKTTFALEELARSVRGRIIILEPLTVIVDAIAKSRYGEIAIIKQGVTNEDVQISLYSKITVCTYDSFAKLPPVVDDDLIICDEVHELLSGYGMPDKRPKYEYLFRQLLAAKNVLCISATPPGFLQEYGFKYVEVKAGQSHKIQLTPISCKGKVQHELAKLLPTLDFANYQYLVRLNDLKLIDQIVSSFQGLPTGQVAVLSSQSKGVAGGAYQAITDSKHIPENIRLLFTTSLIDCGVDLYNQRLRVIMAEHQNEHLSVSNALQFMARPRKMPLLPVTLYKQERKGKEYDSEAAYQAIKKFAQQECQTLNLLNTQFQDLSPYLPKGSYYLRETAKYCSYNKETECYEVNKLLIHYEVGQAIIRSTATADFYSQMEAEGHIVMQDPRQVKVEKTPETQALDKAAKAARKCVEEQALALLETCCTTATYTALHHATRDLELRRQIVRLGYDVRMSEEAGQLQEAHQDLFTGQAALPVFKNYLKLQERDIGKAGIVSQMREHRGARKFGDLLNRLDTCDRIKHYERLGPADKRDVDRILRHKQAIEGKVTESTSINSKIGNRVTADTVTAVMNSDRDIAIKLTKEKAMQLFRLLFDTDMVVVKENGKTAKYFGIVADKTKALHADEIAAGAGVAK